MSYTFNGTTGKYLSGSIPTLSSTAGFTLVCYATTDASIDAAIKVMFSIGTDASIDDGALLGRQYAAATYRAAAASLETSPGNNVAGGSGTVYTQGSSTWYCFIGYFLMYSDGVVDAVTAYVGAPGGSIAASQPASTRRTLQPWPTQTRIGSNMNNLDNGSWRPWMGKVSDCAIYEGDIGGPARTKLLTFSPDRTADVGVTPKPYWPLNAVTGSVYTGGGTAHIGGTNVTATGSPTYDAQDCPSLTRTAGASVAIISGLNNTNLLNGQQSIVITGTNFGAVQGVVRIVPTDAVAGAGSVAQTVTAWSDTSITFTASQSALAFDTTLYLFVVPNTNDPNAAGSPVIFVHLLELLGQAIL